MEDISNVYVTEYIPTIYTTPATVNYEQNGKNRTSHVFLERNGVVIVIYNKTKDTLILVKQFRPSVYHQIVPEIERQHIDVSKYSPKDALTLEFCAGLEDKNIPTIQVAMEEILEECGYEVAEKDLEFVMHYPNLSETTGARTTLFYCEVTEDQRVHLGGGSKEEHEIIEVIEMPVKDVIEYTTQSYICSPSNFLAAFYWFLYNKYNKRY